MSGSAIDALARAVHEHPDDGNAAFEYASALDAADREREAIPLYRRAIACRLTDDTAYRAHVQLGSSLRVTGDAAEAVAVHRAAVRKWPDGAANRLFLALALHAAGRADTAVAEAITAALTTSADDVEDYRRALTGYAERLADPGGGDRD